MYHHVRNYEIAWCPRQASLSSELSYWYIISRFLREMNIRDFNGNLRKMATLNFRNSNVVNFILFFKTSKKLLTGVSLDFMFFFS